MRFITVDRLSSIVRLWPLAIFISLASSPLSVAQRTSILAQPDSELSYEFAKRLSERLSERKIRVDDMELSRSAAASTKIDNLFNLPIADARRLGSLLGTPFYVLINGGNFRRTSFQDETYYEAFAAIYIVSSGSGRLVRWDLISAKESTEAKAQQGLFAAADQAGRMVSDVILREIKTPSNPSGTIRYPPVPDDKTPSFDGLRPPIPYKRISPQYTPTANLYSVEATVDFEVNIDTEGRIVSAEIVRWAGYGLDESVDETVRKMNWRPATIGVKPLPMRVLLRYNFKKLEKNDDN